MDVLKAAHEEANGADSDAVAIDLFTAPTTRIDPELLDALGSVTSAKLRTMRELSTDAERISRLISDLVTDGLAQRLGERLSLPR